MARYEIVFRNAIAREVVLRTSVIGTLPQHPHPGGREIDFRTREVPLHNSGQTPEYTGRTDAKREIEFQEPSVTMKLRQLLALN